MKSKIVMMILLFLFPFPSFAQSLEVAKLNDWQFRFYVCKNVVMSAAILVQIMNDKKVSGQIGLESVRADFEGHVTSAILVSEKDYPFTDGEAAFAAALTFSVLTGMISGGFELTTPKIISTGNSLCVSAIEGVVE